MRLKENQMARDTKFEVTFGPVQADWPTLSASQANELSLEKADLKLEANRKVLFSGNGQISAIGDLSFLTAGTPTVPALTIFANGNVGIGTGTRQPTDKLEVVGTVTATSFIGEFPGLTEKVSKAGDTMTGSLTVNGTVTATSFIGDGSQLTGLPSSSDKVSKAGDTMTGSLTVNGTVTATSFIGDGSQLTGIGGTSLWVGDEAKISYTGNVGIGTDASTGKLEIRSSHGDWLFLRQQQDKGGGFHIHNPWRDASDASENRLEIGYKTSDNRDLWGQFVIHGPTGNVGIGTATPSAKLHIYEPKEEAGQGGSIKFFDKGADWKYEVSYDGGTDGKFTFTNTGIASGETRFQSTASGKLLTIKNTGEVSGRLVNTSSRELKENITDFSAQEAIEVLANLNPVKFNYREDNQKQLKAGFIAEDVPELLATADKKGICALDIVAVLTKVIQQQQGELSSLKERLNALEATA